MCGWSEKYWDDVNSDLEKPATQAEPTSEKELVNPPAPDMSTDTAAQKDQPENK